MSVNGVPGLYCAPPCNTVPGYDCDPAEVPGVTAMPECMIAVNGTDNNYCALICNTDASDNQCDAKGGAKCHRVSGNQGVCTYTQAESGSKGSTAVGKFQSLRGNGSSAPAHFLFKLNTDIDGTGVVVLNITRAWAPLGVDRLWALIQDHFFDGAAFFRVVGGFVVQFGIAGTPAENAKWGQRTIKDDPVIMSNVRHTMSFATAGPDTRTTQLFINYANNSRLDAQGFAPVGIVVEGAEYLDRVHDPTPGDSGGVNQEEYETKGDSWIRAKYPEINFIKTAIAG